MMKRIKAILVLLALTMTLFACKGADVKASAENGVNVVVPAKMDIIFNQDGTTSVSDMYVINDSLIPIAVQSVSVKEFNNWEVVPKSQKILADSKEISLLIDDRELSSGSNTIRQNVTEGTRYDFNVTVQRGAWTKQMSKEKALEFEVKYEIGSKQFSLTLDANGGTPNQVLKVENGTSVTLPTPTREGYLFEGWQDENGNKFKSDYAMPIGDVTLTATWRKLTAYAIFSESDGSFTMVKSADEIKAGQTYNGKTVTTVYTGFEEAEYTYYTQVPWYIDKKYGSIKSVVIADTIKPKSTAYWFYNFANCGSFDVAKLDTSNVTNMSGMFEMSGRSTNVKEYRITGLENWNTSKVTTMYAMFQTSGQNATTYNIGNIGKWDVSNVTSMCRTFNSAAYRATSLYIGDLSTWNTGRVETTLLMFKQFGYYAPNLNIGNIGKWNVSKVTDMGDMFSHFGGESTTIYVGDLSTWDVSNVTDFSEMFYWCGMHVTTWNFGNLGKWNVSKATNMFCMFTNIAKDSKTLYLGTIQNWNTANVTSMGSMFQNAGKNVSWSLNCRSWNVKKVTNHTDFNLGVESKVTAPAWVN